MKKKAYVVDTMGVWFWQSFVEEEEEKKQLEKLGERDVILAEDAEKMLEKGFLRVLEKNNILQPFFIVGDCKEIKIEKGGE